LPLSTRKLGRDLKYTLLLAFIIGSGLASWILLPSISDQLYSNLYYYSNRVATYVIVSAKGNLGGINAGLLPPAAIQLMSVTKGVEQLYAFKTNYTYLTFHNISGVAAFGNGTKREVVFPSYNVGVLSAPVGIGYFPPELVSLVEGRLMRSGEAGFISNCDGALDFQTHSPLVLNKTYNVSASGATFNASVMGKNAINPLYQEICTLWDPSFLKQELGPANFTAEFQGDPNYAIVKVDSINDVRSVVASMNTVLNSYPGYVVTFDEATLIDLQNLQQQSGPLYHLIGWIAPISTASIALFASFLASGRRSWEGGLLISQGWNRRRVFTFVLSYHGLISIVATVLGGFVSYVVNRFVVFRYQVYGAELVIFPSLVPIYLVSSLPLALGISAIIAVLESWRLRRLNLESALRDY